MPGLGDGVDDWVRWADEAAWAERERYEGDRMATPAEAHAEWHRNAGVPMGQPGCPQDACHLPEDPEDLVPPTIRCAHCKERHYTVNDVRVCSGV